MKVEIKSTATTKKSGTSAKGRAYEIVEQEGWVTCNGEYRRLRIGLADGAHPFAPGEYTLGEGSFLINQYGQLEVGRIELVPASKVKAA